MHAMLLEDEQPQGHQDVLALIARLRQIERAAPEKGPACRRLLDKLLPHAGQPGGAADGSAGAGEQRTDQNQAVVSVSVPPPPWSGHPARWNGKSQPNLNVRCTPDPP